MSISKPLLESDQEVARQLSLSSKHQSEVDLFLIGKTGNGKSATGNSILRKPKSFVAKSSTDSVTTEIHFDYSVFYGRTIKVVDGPGVGDTRMSDEEALKSVQDRLKYAIAASPDGYHAFLLVVRYGGRFTREDIQTINSLKQIFGLDFVKNFCIIVITCGDNLKTDEEDSGTNFDQWLEEQGGCFKELLQECSGRVTLFDNKTKDSTEKNDQVTRLLSIVDSLGGKRYTDESFEKAKLLREKQMIESKEPRIREETLKETAVLIEVLKEIKKMTPENQIPRLADVVARASKLDQCVKEQDKNTGVLKYSLEAARSIVDQVKSQLDHCEKVISDKKKAEEEQKRRDQEYQAKLKQEKEEHEKQIAKQREIEERKRQEDRKQMEATWEKQRQEEAKRQKEKWEALQKEMATKSEQEREQMQKEFNERMKKQNEEADIRREKEQKELEEKIQKQQEEANKQMKMAEEKFRKELEDEKKRREEDELRREKERERERLEEQKRHDEEMEAITKKAEEAYGKARDSKEKEIGSAVFGIVQAIANTITEVCKIRAKAKKYDAKKI